MGNISDMVKSVDRAEEKEKAAKEQLEVLMKLADAQLDTFESKLKSMFLDRESAAKTSVPGRRALRFERSVRVDTRAVGAPDVDEAFFGAGDTGGKGVLEGFKAVVKTGLKTILGDTSAGESYDEKFFVCIKHNAIVRVDMHTYRYNFSNEGVISTHKNVLAYILCILVDHADVTVDEIIYLASEFAGDKVDEFEKYLEMLVATWKKFKANDLDPRLKTLPQVTGTLGSLQLGAPPATPTQQAIQAA